MSTENKVKAKQTHPRAWRLLQDAIGPIDPQTSFGVWAAQVHDDAEDLLEALHEYGLSPTPAKWVEIDGLAVSLSDVLAGTLR